MNRSKGLRSAYVIGELVLASMLLFVLTCSKSTTGDDEGTDKTPPVVIADLAVIGSTTHSLTLQWTTPKDYRDDHSGGMVDKYDIRVSYDSITSANFAQAHSFDSVPGTLPAGMAQTWEVDNLEPDSAYYFAIKSCDDKGNWSGISNCCRGHCPGILPVAFADTALEKVVREHLGKPTGDLFTSDVDTITNLDGSNRGIVSLVGLEYCLSLHGIGLASNEITDISPLAGLDQIWGLDITFNHISDLSPLTGMVGLHQLHIGENPITNIGPLATMTSLQQLFLYETQVTDFSPLYNLQFLDDIHFGSMNLTDLSFMSHLTHLRIAQLVSNHISSLTPLAGLTTLQGLGVGNNEVSDLSPLTGLVNLRGLDLTNNQITDLQALVDNAGLDSTDVVHVGSNPLSQQALNVQIPALEARGVTVYHE